MSNIIITIGFEKTDKPLQMSKFVYESQLPKSAIPEDPHEKHGPCQMKKGALLCGGRPSVNQVSE